MYSEPIATRFFESRFVVPAWWVRAFESGTSHRALGASALDMAIEGRLAPALTATELQALASILADLQRQVLEGQTRALSLDPEDHRKQASAGGRAKSFSFDRMLQVLSALRILREDGPSCYAAHPIFRGESWQREGDGSIRLELEPAALGAELLTGVVEAHSDLLRHMGGDIAAQILVGGASPLVLWRSLWLDLTGIDQVLLLRLEKAMQWEFRWLDTEGGFGVNIGDLFQDLELPRAGSIAGRSNFASTIATLARLGRRLVDHGLISSHTDHRYMALTGHENRGPILAWQATRVRVEASDPHFFISLCAKYYLRVALEQGGGAFGRALSHGLDFDVQMFQHMWQAVHQAALAEKEPTFLVKDGVVLLAPTLYCEWWLRQQAGHHIPLPPALQSSPLARGVRGDLNAIGDAFARFCVALRSDTELRHALWALPGATLAAQVSWPFIPKPNDKAKVLPSPPLPLPVNIPRSFGGGDQALKRLAGTELGRLRGSDSEAYQQLKQAYIDALDENRRKIVLEMQVRSQPQSFDDYLRHSLIKFMVENPAVWRGNSSGVFAPDAH